MRVLKNLCISMLCGILLAAGTVFVAPHAERVFAETSDDLQRVLNQLLTQVASLQTQVRGSFTAPRAPASFPIPATFRFSRTLQSGARGEDVRYLQMLLNEDRATRATVPGAETGYFGPATKAAVVRFQNKYAAEVLAPARLSRGTGAVGTLTRNKLNALITAKTAILPATATAPASTAASGTAMPLQPAPTLPVFPAVPPAAPLPSFDEINGTARNALVNIICTTKRSGSFNPLSGSGVVIDTRGVILTNAHVAEYFLLKDYLVPDFVECLIRTGQPARNAYRARLLYISPPWVARNASKLTEASPTGTGEHDFAFLLITGTTNPETPLPASFPALPMDFSDNALKQKGEALVAAYPAEFLGGISIQKDLYPVSSIVNIGEVFSFSEVTPDLFSIGGSAVAQHGSSGGTVVSHEGKLIGLVVTSTGNAMTGDRDLRAITMSHIARSFKEDARSELSALLSSDLPSSADSFNQNVAPALKQLLESAITPQR